MLEYADRPIDEVVAVLATRGVEAGFLVPTATGLRKSIMDAHAPLRDFLAREGIHAYAEQPQGTEAKVLKRAWFVGASSMAETKVSLYRPDTKLGDPRIWFYDLGNFAQPGNVLALLAHKGELYAVNTSAHGLLESAKDPRSHLGRLLYAIASTKNEPADELLSRLREISSRGFVPSLRNGPTGVGMTLETLLGIKANSNRAPDYRGIEIKAARTLPSGAATSRTTLFSKVPDWGRSAINGPVPLLERYGYVRLGRRQLYCSMNHSPNTLGLFLSVEGDSLHARHGEPADASKVVQWGLSALRESLAAKHHQTFWVKARVERTASGLEAFHYTDAIHTQAPMVSNLDTLLALGHIEVDFALHLVERRGKTPRARDHGYLFKLHQRNLPLLFPPSVLHSLLPD